MLAWLTINNRIYKTGPWDQLTPTTDYTDHTIIALSSLWLVYNKVIAIASVDLRRWIVRRDQVLVLL